MKNEIVQSLKRGREMVAMLLFSIVLLPSCQKDPEGQQAQIRLQFSGEYDYSSMKRLMKGLEADGAAAGLPDTNDFILTVRSESGQVFYEGRYGDRPEQLSVPSGTYELQVVSRLFSQPEFSAPVYGDSQILTVRAPENVAVSFFCSVQNSGLRLRFTPQFRQRFPAASPRVESDHGTLEYPYGESRIGFFSPSRVTVRLNQPGQDLMIVSRNLRKGEVLTLTLNASGSSASQTGHMGIIVDTSMVWTGEDFDYDSSNDGSTKDKALSVGELGDFLGSQNVWVKGYIVGGDVTTAVFATVPPFKSATHIAMADQQKTVERRQVSAVELKSSSKIREALNLIANPSVLGHIVYIHGDVEKYFGYPGLKNVDEFELR